MNKNILLIEPGYRNKYPPLGLMKIAQYHNHNGKKDNVTFIKGEDKRAEGVYWDRVYITTLFSFEWSRIGRSIDFAINLVNGQTDRVFAGGIAVSLMHERFLRNNKWAGVRFIKGLLDKSPAESLMLNQYEEELYSEDVNGTPIEDMIPDYSILDQIDYEYPINDAYFAYASRGCIRKCKFCGVPKLEGDQRDAPPITKVVRGIIQDSGEKKDLILMDNNVVASANYKNIIAEIRDLGFQKGAKLERNGKMIKRRVDFNQGVDARILCKDPMFLKEMSTIEISPLRIAFDHLGLKKQYSQAMQYSADVGITNLSNYMLYNFHDSPADLFERMRLNVTLNEELGIRIFSFPMRYQPTNLPHRYFVGEKWKRYTLRSMQIILQATHGIVSGAPDYFKHAFGNTYEQFQHILNRPQHFIFNRDWYERGEGKAEFEEYKSCYEALTENEIAELIDFLSRSFFDTFGEHGEKEGLKLSRPNLISAIKKYKNSKIRNMLNFYIPLDKDIEREIWDKQKENRILRRTKGEVSEEDLVEDAGLYDEDFIPPEQQSMKVKGKVA